MSKLYQIFQGNWPAKITQKGSPLTFLLLHFSHHNPLLCCHRPSTVREGISCRDSRILWQHQPNYRASCNSWRNTSRAMWQLHATLASSQSSKKREILPPGPYNPMTCNASLPTLPSREPLEDTLSSSDQASPSLSHTGLFGQPTFNSSPRAGA